MLRRKRNWNCVTMVEFLVLRGFLLPLVFLFRGIFLSFISQDNNRVEENIFIVSRTVSSIIWGNLIYQNHYCPKKRATTTASPAGIVPSEPWKGILDLRS